MPLRVACPHCRTPCLVAEHHRGVPLQCGRCGRTFTTAPAAPSRLRLDIGVAAPSRRIQASATNPFLVRQLSWCNHDEWHEWAVLVMAEGPALRAADAALTPLLNNALQGTNSDLRTIGNSLAATVLVIRDGEVVLVEARACRLHHRRAGRLASLAAPLKLAAEDWLFAAPNGLDAALVQAETEKCSASAVSLARQLAERLRHPVGIVRCS